MLCIRFPLLTTVFSFVQVIHYFLIMLTKRDEQLCNEEPSRKRCHFFKSFFMTKVLNEGHSDSSKNGKYDYKNVKRWSKKVPGTYNWLTWHNLMFCYNTHKVAFAAGKDIFNLDKIFFPINQGGVHWVCAVIFMQKKRIQFYDSLGGRGRIYLNALFEYIKDEHQAKKDCPLPNEDEWELVDNSSDTPRQRNGKFEQVERHLSWFAAHTDTDPSLFPVLGFDCGVFTCMFADFLSKDCPLVFDQSHITLCRERIAVSIMNGQAIM